ncbi:MAG: Glu-tRNA(Gln) amidotransferase subunit GatE [Candidatus Zixiibacteriota bacterium]
MNSPFDPLANYERTREQAGWVRRSEATPETYARIGFKCGLEIHQQLLTRKKLFCNCPAGRFNTFDDYQAELIRHMRPTLSELGEYDGTALMEFKTRKNITYRIKHETACTYEIDDTPPFKLNQEALHIAIEIGLMLKMNVVGELHITRKQYLDGSIPTGFQRTGIVAIEGSIPLRNKTVRIIQLSIEEDSCREVSDIGHHRIYQTDRLGMPLIESVTYPDMTTPDEAREAAQYLRFVARSSGKVRTGMGAAREDVNVSVTRGTRIEIKGVSRIQWIPRLTHCEAFRQWSLLMIMDELKKRSVEPKSWKIAHKEIDFDQVPVGHPLFRNAKANRLRLVAVNLPKFKGILSHFTQMGQCFADELIGRLKVVACIEKPNMTHSEEFEPSMFHSHWHEIGRILEATDDDAQLIIIGPADDIPTALDVIEERCKLAMMGVPNETRKGLPDGTNIFERVLPGPDRMYPDTDSAPISIDELVIQEKARNLPPPVSDRMALLRSWKVPEDTFLYLLKKNLVGLVERIVKDFEQDPIFVSSVLAHTLKHAEGAHPRPTDFSYEKVYDLFAFGKKQKLYDEILKPIASLMYECPNMDFESILITLEFKPVAISELLVQLPTLKRKFAEIRTSKEPGAAARWIMGVLRSRAIGNVCLETLRAAVDKELAND